MTNIEKRTQFIEEKAIMAAHPECKTLEEAKQRDLKTGCYILDSENIPWLIGLTAPGGQYWIMSEEKDDHAGVMRLDHRRTDFKILGLATTLDRVLNALQKIDSNYCFVKMYITKLMEFDETNFICDWKLLNKNGTSATINDQSDDTIIAISELLGCKE